MLRWLLTARALWAAAQWWNRRRVAVAGTAIVGIANGIISYDALRAASAAAGAPSLVTWLFPAAADGIVAVMTPAALELEEAPWHARAKVWALLWAAIVVSVIGNASRAGVVWSGMTIDVYGLALPIPSGQAIWLSIPPVMYAGCLHGLVLMHRYPLGWKAAKVTTSTTGRAPKSPPTSKPGARSKPTKTRVRQLVQRALPGRVSGGEIAAATGRSEGHARRVRSQVEREVQEGAPA